jgi:DNA end-binding protein Ku
MLVVTVEESSDNGLDHLVTAAPALKALVEKKKKGHKPAKVARPDDTEVVELMSALRASLSAKDKGAGKPADKAKPAKAKTREASRG